MTLVSAKIGKDSQPVEIDYDFGEDLDQMVEKFGAEVVFDKARANMVVNLQSYIRTQISAQKSPDEIQRAAAEWSPGVKKKGKSAAEKVREVFGNMSAEEKSALLKELKNG